MKKTSKTARITMLLVVLCLISTAMLSGTFAKYTSEFAGEDTALIAKWDISVKDGTNNELEVSPAIAELDLFKHAYTVNINEKDGSDYIIAPGVNGEFSLKIQNKGDVAAKITFDLDKTGTAGTVPIEYSVDGGNTWVNLDDLKGALDGLSQMNNVAETNGTADVTVKWQWQFERGTGATLVDNDEADTLLGTTSAASANRSTYILTIKATATQIAPAAVTP
ncbi:MAG: hypothetical protein BWY65_02283 [Firmicutes bacterium ADurb.Bin373]|nr:MAG: hypothetical protein BWY65_02283 [Firmicutes bacterium ADurb.Bin373]